MSSPNDIGTLTEYEDPLTFYTGLYDSFQCALREMTCHLETFQDASRDSPLGFYHGIFVIILKIKLDFCISINRRRLLHTVC